MQLRQHSRGEPGLINQPGKPGYIKDILADDSCRLSVLWLYPAIIFIIIFLAYFWSAPSTVTLEDDGYFILVAFYNGIAHPPGYPLYSLLAHISTWFPFGSIALRVHLLSILFGALTCLCLWWITYLLFRKKTIACLVALGFGFSTVFWSQSIIAEVYSLQLLIFSLLFLSALFLLRVDAEAEQQNLAKIIFLLTGLGLSNHWPLLILSLPCLAAVIWPVRKVFMQNSLRAIPWFLAGLLPYVWMVYRSLMNPEISFFGTIINSVSDFWFYISRAAYSGIDASESAGFYDKLQFTGHFLQETLSQFGLVGGVFVIAGFIYQWRILPVHICAALILGYTVPSLGLICLLDFDYDFLHQAIFRVYPLVCYWVAAIWLGIGVMFITYWLTRHIHGNLAPAFAVKGFALLLVATTFIDNAVANYRADDDWAERYATVILKTMPENAVFFASSDTTLGPVGYMHHVRKFRNDIELYSLAGTLFKNRLFEPYKVDDAQISIILNGFFTSTTRPVYYNDYLRHDYGQEFYGLYYRLLMEQEHAYQRIVALPAILAYLESISRQPLPVDPWKRIHYRLLHGKGCKLLTLVTNNSLKSEHDKRMYQLKDNLCSNLLGQYIQIEHELNSSTPDRYLVYKQILRARDFLGQALTKEQYSRLDYLSGVFSMQNQNYSKAQQHFRKCIEKWPHPDNPAYVKLDELTSADHQHN